VTGQRVLKSAEGLKEGQKNSRIRTEGKVQRKQGERKVS